MNRSPVLILILVCAAAINATADFQHFVTRDGDRLMDGPRELKFVSFNIPNLHYVEDDMLFERTNPFRMPDAYEIGDALETLQQMGGQVVRIYTLPTFQKSASRDTPKYVLAPGKFNEEAFQTLDRVLALCNHYEIRIIIPIVNNFKWWGGAVDYAAFRGKAKDDFWTDPQIIADFKQTVDFLINRVNTVTGVPYKQDKAILCWETGNETQCPHTWTRDIATHIKSLDATHLVMDGYYTSVLRDESINDDAIDIVQTHHYENDPRQMVEHVKVSAAKARGKKPYVLGEFGFISTEGTRAVLDTVIQEGFAGALIWSLRIHHRDGGFFWHSEPAGGDFFKAYHWPGFASGEIYDESKLMALMRRYAFEIQGQKVPALSKPSAPTLLPFTDVGQMRWQGSAGAAGYRVERAVKADGPWRIMARNLSDARTQYRPLFSDTQALKGHTYYYRVRARNTAGLSAPSNVVGPVKVQYRTFVDEFANNARIFYHSKGLEPASNEARRYKEDLHRLDVKQGQWLIYHIGAVMEGFSLFAFQQEAGTNLKFSASRDGKSFMAIDISLRDYASGSGEYGYLRPNHYSHDDLPGDCHYLKIESVGPVSLSRMEIRY